MERTGDGRRMNGDFSVCAEEALRSSERNLTAIINTIPTAAWTTRPDGYCDFLNQVWLDYAGMTAEQAQGWEWAEAIHPDDRPKLIEEWQSCLASGTPVDTEARIRRFDSSYRWFLIRGNPLRDEGGNILKWYGTCVDIDDRKRGEEALRTRELSWRQIVDNIPGLVATTGAMGEVEFLNRQTLEYFGKTSKELKDWALIDAVHPDDLPHVIEARKKSIETGQIYEVEHRCRRGDGVYRWFQVRGLPVRNAEGTTTAWYLLLTDIEDRKRGEEALQARELEARSLLDHMPGFLTRLSSDGTPEVFNRPFLQYLGKTLEEIKKWKTSDIIHPDDRARIIEVLGNAISTGQPFDFEYRGRRFDGVYRWFQVRGVPVRSVEGQILHWNALTTDIDDRKKAEEALQSSQRNLSLMIDVIPTFIGVLRRDGIIVYANKTVLDYTGLTLEDIQKEDLRSHVFHPEDVERLREERRDALARAVPFENEQRMLGKDGSYRWFLVRYSPLLDEQGRIDRWYVAGTDIEDRKKAEEALHARELEARSLLDHMPGFLVRLSPDFTPEMFNRPYLQYLGKTAEEAKKWQTSDMIHPDDLAHTIEVAGNAISTGQSIGLEHRVRRFDGIYRWFQSRVVPVRNIEGQILHWNGLATDIEDRKKAEEALQSNERNLGLIINTMPTLAWSAAPDGPVDFLNQRWLDYTGLSPEQGLGWGWTAAIHPDDLNRIADYWRAIMHTGEPGEIEARFRRSDGEYRWFLFRANAVRDESGTIVKWYGTNTDIDDRKRAENKLQNALAEIKKLKDQLYEENVALREEVDKASMFEEVIGASSALRAVLCRVSKVAPTDSTVLITGETGTGKELIARAIHRHSKRSKGAFISVNCAAMPRDLIASELFGHEKGAFTGATQQRLGRFELAHGGTIFLDEVGELPMETQVALLRVLQEQEFERVGGSQTLRVNVRVIAATNRDLEAAIVANTFRRDLFYRLNVFPIEIPPLRERKEDIPLLVEYFIDRFARKAGKNIRGITKRTLDLLQSYPWPGNIRELQNVIERSVIVSETENFSVDDSWLSRQPIAAEQDKELTLSKRLPTQEKAIIEAALRESGGRVSGPSGAAVKLGISGSTLDSKIRSLKIDKNRFKVADPTKNHV